MLLLMACAERTTLAPVVERYWQEPDKRPGTHKVEQGETLYAIAFRYDLDYRELATRNHLSYPYLLRVGQVLHIKGKPTRIVSTSSKKANDLKVAPKTSHHRAAEWIWPVKGKIIHQFNLAKGKKGIDIAGRKGIRVKAAASGTVAYAGNGLSGYGNLIIIKHNHNYLTAYGHNAHILVREGQYVKAGQVIADMGLIDRRYWGLHFELRKGGKPVNPLGYL